jgi:hypothetical protein
MNKVELVPVGQKVMHRSMTPRAPKAANILLPVWGYGYIRQFLECGLPTLLALGNLPAVAAALPTTFTLLTSADDEAFIREDSNYKRLAGVCETKIRLIDHLITDRNNSTTITLAYAEAVRETGAEMVDTCFFFLVSDYIMADGSLANVLKRMQRGASAVVVGNFQVASDDALPWLQDKLTAQSQGLALSARDLMRWALNHLHPATLANTVNIPFNHNSHTNRLFWRVDDRTIIGRFYLMHMLCVRPEVCDFVIGASCDYSFIPEMCPSGNVEAITDSDEYLVVELQPRRHESAFLRPGPLTPRALAKSLSDWTTRTHRENAHHALIFHAGELPSNLDEKIDETDAFVADIGRRLARKPLPYRGHPYWRGAMAAFYDATGRKLSEDDWRYALNLPATEDWVTQWLLWHAKYTLMGRPPRVLPWHPAWPDFKAVLGEIAPFFSNPKQQLLMLSNEPTAFTLSLADSGERVHRLRCAPFLRSPPERYAPLRGKFDLCLLELYETDMEDGRELINRIVPLMKRGARIIISVINRGIFDEYGEFGRVMAFNSTNLISFGAVPTEVHFIQANAVRRLVRAGLLKLRQLMSKGPWISVPSGVIGGGFLLCLSFIGNIDALRTTRRVNERGHKSSFVMRLIVDAADAADDRAEAPLHTPGHPTTTPAYPPVTSVAAAGAATREPQYARCVELRETVGLTSLGLMTNQVWHDDPRRLVFLLARYKFVAKMLSGCRDVGEVGCGDAFGTRVVLQEVSDVTVYDFDRVFIEDIRARRDQRWVLKAEVHDIVAAPLPRKHQALFSLDVLEHIAVKNEHAYLTNLCRSLSSDGVLIIGTPSIESQPYASPPSKAGHVNCKSGPALKALLSKYFKQVLMFSMNDEIVHTGFFPMSHYLFAICMGPKWEARDRSDRLRAVSPSCEICELPSATGFYVNVIYPDCEPHRVDGFATVADAAHWIGNMTVEWMRGNPIER